MTKFEIDDQIYYLIKVTNLYFVSNYKMVKAVVKYSVVKISTDIVKDVNITAPAQPENLPNSYQTKIPIMVFLWSSWMGNQVSCITYSFDKGGNIHYLMDTIDGRSVDDVIKNYYPEITEFKLSSVDSAVELRKSLESDLEIKNIQFFFGRAKYEGMGNEKSFNKNHLVSYLVDVMISSFPISQFNGRIKTESKVCRSKARQIKKLKEKGQKIDDKVSVVSGMSDMSDVSGNTSNTDGIDIPDNEFSEAEKQALIDEYKNM